MTEVYRFHYRCDPPKLGAIYYTQLPVDEVNDALKYTHKHSFLEKAFDDDTPTADVLEYFKTAHREKTLSEIENAERRIRYLKNRIELIDDL